MRGHRFLAAGAICVALAAVSHGASAAGGKALDGSYFFGSCYKCVHSTVTIAGQTIRGTDIIIPNVQLFLGLKRPASHPDRAEHVPSGG